MAVEAKRGCGYRKVGGLYMVSGVLSEPCHRLPFELHVCPTCNQGIKADDLLGGSCKGGLVKPDNSPTHCAACPVCSPTLMGERQGLLWIGERFYKNADQFRRESATLGISRRVKAIPRGFKLGETWVLFAHPKAVRKDVYDKQVLVEEEYAPGIFSAFKPTAIELILTESQATEEKLKELADKKITPVIVPDDDKDHQGSVFDKEEEK